MKIVTGLEEESYKYAFGVYQRFEAPFDEHKAISLVCGRNDRAAWQLLLYSDEEMLVAVNGETCFYERGPITIVRVEAVLTGIGDGRIGASLIGLVEDDDRQWKSDMILPQPSAYVEKRKVQPIWIEAELGADAEPGVYYPEIRVYGHRMFEDETLIRTLKVELQVLDVALPDPKDYRFYLDLWQHNSNIARKYDVELWSDAHFAILENYVSSLAAIGQKAITVIVSEIPWSGQASCYDRIDPANVFEYSIVRVTRRGEDEWTYDFRALNRYVELCMSHGIDSEIEVFGLLNIWVLEDAGYGGVIRDHDDAIRIRYYDERTRAYGYIREKRQLERYVAALSDNFAERGWADKVRIAADEPADLERFRGRLQSLQAMAPSFQYKVAIGHAEFIAEEGLLDHVPIIDCVAGEFEQLETLMQGKKGKTLFYVACNNERPNTFICSPLLESRLLPWLARHWGLDGFLRWNYTVWPNDPLKRIAYHYPLFPAGDTNFVYPGKDGKPVLTLRYKLLQKGIRDFEIMDRYVRSGGDPEKLARLMRRVFRWSDASELHQDSRKTREELYSLDHSDYESVIGELLAEMSAPDSRRG
ncbi:DUF4091 domain-containing protein [Paenibacillus sacheonensis]|uniref:DUF4091 domain-containing protein n=1 Tax=Paenibacillus sacheonensis TaxID=742054 RepID=A0A7X4YJ80_9BACL|nr:DUF4091 domain-containing protein [Paenibacillus sacheonensis]MBM7564293.1 hypothetical protein [Paenibacillus sacheonensis]NBC67385.1 DUF4091 domain-containing protein [Paenibacillus sacheonensis]